MLKIFKATDAVIKKRVSFTYRLLVIGCLGMFFAGFIDPSLWFFGPLSVGFYLFIYSGTVFFIYRKHLGTYKHKIKILLGIVLVAFVFMALMAMGIK